MWLDSSAADAGSRFDILVADPYVTLRTRGAATEIVKRDGSVQQSQRPPFELVREQLGDVVASAAELPFCGGAVGYFGYDLGRRLERIPTIAAADIAMPDLAIGIYDWAVVVNHAARRTWLVGHGRDARTFERWPDLVARVSSAPAEPQPPPFRVLRPPRANLDRSEYAAAFRAVQEHIRRGDCYQVNLTQRFEAEAEGDAWHAYLQLRAINPAPFAAYLDLPDGKVVCSSPERFLSLRNGHVETKPIKGTRPRSKDPAPTTWANAACPARCARASCSTSSRSRACTSSSAPSREISRPVSTRSISSQRVSPAARSPARPKSRR
jgi:para-aminobenzoate synthetase component 1